MFTRNVFILHEWCENILCQGYIWNELLKSKHLMNLLGLDVFCFFLYMELDALFPKNDLLSSSF